MLPQKVKDPFNDIHVALALILGMNQEVMQINYNKNIELLAQDLIDIFLKASQCVK